MKKGNIHIGTSGWHYKHWRGTFYPKEVKDKEMLKEYLKSFNTVEINNSFYRLPEVSTFEDWKNTVPDNFTFAVKGSRYISHMKKLILDEQALHQLIERAKVLEQKLGPILFQLPPGWKINAERLENFLDHLPATPRFVFEFRNQSWYDPRIYELLKSHQCAFCIYELAGHLTPFEVTADFVYIRLHGPGDKYQGSYPDATLKEWAKRCTEWSESGKDVYVYFDNDQNGYAGFNAKRLQILLALDSWQ